MDSFNLLFEGIIMGKGDKKSKRGKIIKGTYGKMRPRKNKPTYVPKKSTSKSETSESK